MKELSIEEKAKRYDEALKKANNCLKDGTITNTAISYIENIFPELNESEDEKIKKCLLSHFSRYQEDEIFLNGITMKQIVAWIEKQGKQKSVNKVVPKFKVGNWVVIEVGELSKTLLITKVEKDKYLYWFNDDSYLPFTEEQCLRLWNIQDAKAGDVLYLQKDGKEHIIIYKGVIKERFRTFVSAYCAYNGVVDAFCFADVSRYVDIAYGGIMPATKEQRDTLMKAMADNGYEWDAEKKELKKRNLNYE